MPGRFNQVHPVPPEIAEAIRSYRDSRRAEVARESELVTLARPTDQERAAIAEEYAKMGAHCGVNVSRLQSHARNRVKRLTDSAADVPVTAVARPPQDWRPLLRGTDDPDFWWAETDPILPDNADLATKGTLQPFAAQFQDDGLHLTGMLTYDNGSLKNFSFGADAAFAIDWDRVPQTPLNKWFSAPFIEIFGRIDGWTVPPSFPDGDHWSKCWLHLHQTLLQFLFGPDGPVPSVIGQAEQTINLIFNEGTGYTTATLPGHQVMPEVVVSNIFPQTVWAHLTVTFEVQIEGNAGLWITPPGDVLLRTFQWPFVPVLPVPPHPFHP